MAHRPARGMAGGAAAIAVAAVVSPAEVTVLALALLGDAAVLGATRVQDAAVFRLEGLAAAARALPVEAIATAVLVVAAVLAPPAAAVRAGGAPPAAAGARRRCWLRLPLVHRAGSGLALLRNGGSALGLLGLALLGRRKDRVRVACERGAGLG